MTAIGWLSRRPLSIVHKRAGCRLLEHRCVSASLLYYSNNTAGSGRVGLEEYRAPTKMKLAALWTSTMFCYIYGDYFGLYVTGTLADMNGGSMGPLGHATPGVLLGVSVMMAIPSLMVALSLLLPADLCRWTCVVLGLFYTAIMAISLPASEPFYRVLGAIEMALTLAITAIALRWPREVGRD